MKYFAFLFITMGLFFHANYARADRFSVLLDDFDARGMSVNDKRALQSSLAFLGYYKGLFDGIWGKGSQSSLEKFTKKEFSRVPANIDAALAIVKYFEDLGDEKWDYVYDASTQLSFVTPRDDLYERDWSSKLNRVWNHKNRDISFLLNVSNFSEMAELHLALLDKPNYVSNPYKVRRKKRNVTSLKTIEGRLLYIRSELIDNKWSTIFIGANHLDVNIFNAITGSIVVGRSSSLKYDKGGILDKIISLTFDFVEQDNQQEDSHNTVVENTDKKTRKDVSAGTGFFVDSSGVVLTNAHVVNNCNKIIIKGKHVTLIAKNHVFDLALVRMEDSITNVPHAKFSQRPAKLNSDITVVGYPLVGLLGGLNVTRGAVTSTTGLGGDAVNMQISAPVQPGNSGGPALNENGQVVGVIVSKLDAKKFADATGDIPQNINFAIRGEIAKLFMSQNDVDYEISQNSELLSGVEIAEEAKKYTVLINCQN